MNKENVMNRTALSVTVGAVLLSTAVYAQSNKPMHDDRQMAKPMGTDVTYVGCLEAGPIAHAFVLTHVTAANGKKPGMKTKKSDRMTGTMAAHDNASMMPPSTVSLRAAPVELSDHLGHQVSVAGSLADGTMDSSKEMRELPVLTVRSVKTIAASCPTR
jgi:hypothetical protein